VRPTILEAQQRVSAKRHDGEPAVGCHPERSEGM